MSANEKKYDIEKMRKAHKVLKEFTYELKPVVKGYNDRTLYINLATLEIKIKPVPAEMKKKFIGGKGFDLKLLWDAVSGETRWDSPENEICIATGPIAGNTNYPGSGKSLVTTISPQTGIPIDSNVGGHFGPYLKFSGFDAMEIQGKAERDVLIYIDGNQGKVQIMEAPLEAVDSHVVAEQLHEMFAANEREKQHVSVVSAGRGSEHAWIGCLNFSYWDKRRRLPRLKQAGRGGIGTVFRDKKIKAVVVKYSGLSGKSNDPADLDTLQRTGNPLPPGPAARKEPDRLPPPCDAGEGSDQITQGATEAVISLNAKFASVTPTSRTAPSTTPSASASKSRRAEGPSRGSPSSCTGTTGSSVSGSSTSAWRFTTSNSTSCTCIGCASPVVL